MSIVKISIEPFSDSIISKGWVRSLIWVWNIGKTRPIQDGGWKTDTESLALSTSPHSMIVWKVDWSGRARYHTRKRKRRQIHIDRTNGSRSVVAREKCGDRDWRIVRQEIPKAHRCNGDRYPHLEIDTAGESKR